MSDFKYTKKLKIEFRAVPYAQDKHVLEYRISPNQDLSYENEISWLWGLIKFKVKHKFETNWHRACKFLNYPSAYLYEQEHNYLPVFVDDRKELKKIQTAFSTIGEFFEYMENEDQKEIDKWQQDRNKYLKDKLIWE